MPTTPIMWSAWRPSYFDAARFEALRRLGYDPANFGPYSVDPYGRDQVAAAGWPMGQVARAPQDDLAALLAYISGRNGSGGAVERALRVSIAPLGRLEKTVDTTAFGGFEIRRNEAHENGLAVMSFAFPASTEWQAVDADKRKLLVVDAGGREVKDAIFQSRVIPMSPSMPDRPRLEVSFDLAKLPEPAYFRWSVPVHIEDQPIDLSTPVPLPSREDLPAEVRPWLEPSAMMQSDAPEMKAAAAEIRKGARSIQELVERTLAAMEVIRKPGEEDPLAYQPGGSDLRSPVFAKRKSALHFLEDGRSSSCLPNACLFASLMRANGIPCRVYSQIMGGMGQDMHFTNEYFVPGKGWVHVEPQEFPFQAKRAIQTPRTEGASTGPVYPEMDLSFQPVFFLQMFGMELDGRGHPRTRPQQLITSPGLPTIGDPYTGVAQHGLGEDAKR